MTTDLNVTLSGSDTGLSRAMQQAERATTRATDAMEQYRRSTEDTWSAIARAEEQMARDSEAAMGRRMDAYTNVGRSALIMGGLVSAGLALATKAAMGWETAWTGVLKTVDGSPEEMAALEAELRKLATTLPFTHEEIAAVAEAAGQLGIQRDSVASFTQTMLALGVSTNMTADGAATDFARLAAIMQLPNDQMSNLGSTAVALGNNFATTEGEIVSLGLRLAGTGNQVGLTSADVFGLAAAMSSVGIEAEAGGTAMSTTMAKIQKDVDAGADRVDAFAKVAGMTAEQFTAAWRDDAGAAMVAFVEGLGRVKEQGGSALQTLTDLGIKGVRETDTLLRLSGAGTTLADALGMANESFAENIALQEEADRFYATSENRLKVAGNQAKDLAIDMGAVLLPALVAVGEEFANVLTFVDGLPGPLKTTATVAAVLAAGITLAGGAAMVAVPKFVAFKAAVAALEAGALKSAGTRMVGFASALAGPWGLALAAATVGVGIFAARQGEAAQKVESLRATLDEQTGALTENSREWMVKELVDRGLMARAKELGLDLGLVTDAALGNTDAMAQLNAEMAKYTEGFENSDFMSAWTQQHNDEKSYAVNLQKQLGELANTSEKAIVNGQLAAEANRAHAAATEANAAAQKGLTSSWDEGTESANDLEDAAKALRDAFDALSGGFLDERAASRQVRSSLREIRSEMEEYRKEHGSLDGAFAKGTESGDKFAGMLDDLASNYQDKISSAREAGKSEKELAGIYDRSRASLQRVAEQILGSKAAAEAYVAQVLDIPELMETKVKVDYADADTALERLRQLQSMNISPKVMNIVTNYAEKFMGVKPGAKPKVNQADGGVLSFFADGGVENHVAQIAPAGAWRVWAEPETGGESYIPHAPSKRARSLDIWAETGRILGVPGFASGGVVSGTYGAGGGQSLVYLKDLADAATKLANAQARQEKAERRQDKAESKVDTARRNLSDARSEVRDARRDRPSRVDVLQQRREVRDLKQSLAAKGKDRLTGIDRQIALAQLKEAETELAEMRAAGKKIKSAQKEVAKAKKEVEAAKAQAKKEAEALKAAEKALEEARKAAEAAEFRAERRDDVAAQGDLFSGGSARSVANTLDRLIRDVTDYNAVYQQLAAAGASSWLLGQMDGQARSGNYRGAIRFGRQLLADRGLFARLESQGARLGQLGYAQGQAVQNAGSRPTANVQGVPAAGSTTTSVPGTSNIAPSKAPASTTVINQYIQADQVDLVTNAVIRRLAHEGVI